MRAAAVVEFTGVPIDVDTLNELRAHWDDIKEQLIADVDRDYGVFDGTTFKTTLFEEFLMRRGIPWPRLASGRLALDRDTFKEMGRAYPIVSPLRELKHALSEMRLNALQVGEDGRNRCLLSAFGTKTGRNAPSNTKFIFGPSVWLRGLIKPEPGRAIAYLDWVSQEVGIAASLSGDPVMMSDYQTGDLYSLLARTLESCRRMQPRRRTASNAMRSKRACWDFSMAWATRNWRSGSTSRASSPAN